MANTEKENKNRRNLMKSNLCIISTVFVMKAINIIDKERTRIETIILKKSEK
tara:strand:- start:159 stop:314 length:156 start_codon:yes stop_codon:yes gene_type:complete